VNENIFLNYLLFFILPGNLIDCLVFWSSDLAMGSVCTDVWQSLSPEVEPCVLTHSSKQKEFFSRFGEIFWYVAG